MALENKKLGDLYKETFSGFEASGNAYDWNGVEKRLDKMKFYKLSFSHFNIYYSLLIVTCFVASLTSATHYFFVTVPRVNALTAATIIDSGPVKVIDENSQQKYGNNAANNKIGEKNLKEESQPNVKKSNTSSKTDKENNSIIDYAGAESPIFNKDIKDQLDKSNKDLTISISDETKKKDTVAIAPPINKDKDSVKTQKLLKTPKKTVYITKQDTIFEYDTLKTKKNRKFRK